VTMLVVIDATAINGGPLARTLETASRSAAACGADVRTVRLYDTYGHICARCMGCAGGARRCTSRAEGLAALAATMRSADAMLVGAPSRLFGGDPAAKALLVRLVRAFADQPESRCSAPVPRGGARKRAAVIASCSPPSMVPACVGQMVGTAGTAWRCLTDCGVDIVGTSALLGAWSGAGALDGPIARSQDLGRMLAWTRPGGEFPAAAGRRTRMQRRGMKVATPSHARLAPPMGV
jgi:hypothetical protein